MPFLTSAVSRFETAAIIAKTARQLEEAEMREERTYASTREIAHAAEDFIAVLGTRNRAYLHEALNAITDPGLAYCDTVLALSRALGRSVLGHRDEAPDKCPRCRESAEQPARDRPSGVMTICDHPYHPAELIDALRRVFPEAKTYGRCNCIRDHGVCNCSW